MARPATHDIAWADEPPHDPGISYPVYSPKPGKDVNVVIIGDVLHGVYVHFDEGSEYPCTQPNKPCERCAKGLDRRWKGYLACWDRHRGRLCMAMVTREAYLRCPALKENGGRLRGMVLRTTRAGSAKNARMTAQLSQWTGPVEMIPPAFNLIAALERVWFHRSAPQGTQARVQGTQTGSDAPDVTQPDFFEPRSPYDA